MRNKKANALFFLGGALFVIVLIAMVGYSVSYAFSSSYENVIIDDKWEKTMSGGSQSYMVSSTDGQVFVVDDSIIHMRFDSANMYASLKPGQDCYIKTQGFRFPFFSDFKNIIEADCN
jgi:hypothetical protein